MWNFTMNVSQTLILFKIASVILAVQKQLEGAVIDGLNDDFESNFETDFESDFESNFESNFEFDFESDFESKWLPLQTISFH